MMTTKEIRSTFLDYFKKNDHVIVPSSSLVPHNDPTLMFTNSGMVQFKNIFTGVEKRPYVRAASDQKCVRAGGKHNDLDNVGYTVRHHTFFEMLGNWSFGDYFKEKAIYYAWNLVTKEFGLPQEKLTVTVYHTDDEAFNLWKKIAGLPDERIIRIPTKDNFWSMGDTGPCGPCSEIFYDHGEHIQGGPPGSPDEDGDRFVEIWNLVFMQYEQLADGTRIALPHPCIDTGMGLERMGAVMLGTNDNYETDILKSLINAAAGVVGVEPNGEFKVSLRVVADHLRSSCFLIADGVLPANEGRGYVLRRIMRRAMRHAHLMGCREPLMWRLVPSLVRSMGDAFPELVRAEALMTETLRLEETRFKQTLDRGLKLLDAEADKLPSGGVLSGDVAFRLYDTYGFPLDLTQDVLRGRHMTVDVNGFNQAMERQRAEARKAWAGSGESATDAVWFSVKEKAGATEFLGYDSTQAEGLVKALVVDGKEVDSVAEGQKAAVITNQTPFYGESGGQIGDTGVISMGDTVFAVEDTQKKVGNLFVHQGVMKKGSLSVGKNVLMAIDEDRRAAVARHHSVTHLLQAALRKILGDHVTQKGSSVTPDGLRFDFSQPRQITAEELRAVETEVNKSILKNLKVTTRLMSPADAIEEGAMALFGEKYGDEVRVVSMGDGDGRVSIELCGGTHVRRTGDIGSFRIISESSLAAGVRRIEAAAGLAALKYAESRDDILSDVSEKLKVSASEIPARIQLMQDEKKRLERELSDTRKRMASGGAADSETKTVNGIKFIGQILSDIPAKELKGMADELKKKIGSGVVALVCTSEGKISVVVGVTDDLTGKISAVDLVRAASAAAGGKGGGGRADMAQAGGSDLTKTAEALAAVERGIGA